MDNQHHITVNRKKLPLKMRRHAQARRIVLRFNRGNDMLLVTIPKRVNVKTALDFVEAQREWIADQLAEKPVNVPFVPGVTLKLMDTPLTFHHYTGRNTLRQGRNVFVGGDKKHFSRRMTDFIRKNVREEFCRMAEEIAAEIGVRVAGIAMRDTTSRWGSCSRDRQINLSWRLALAPKRVARYVIAHEIAHLKHFDHSPAFWSLVETLHSNWEWDREWLRLNGTLLHSYGV